MILKELDELGRLTDEVKVDIRKMFEENEKAEMIAEMSPVGIFMTDHLGHITYMNKTFSTITGILPSNEIYRTGWTSKLVDEDERKIAHLFWDNAIKNRRVFEHQCKIKDATGQHIWVIIQARPFKDGSYCGSLTMIPKYEDRTDRRNGKR